MVRVPAHSGAHQKTLRAVAVGAAAEQSCHSGIRGGGADRPQPRLEAFDGRRFAIGSRRFGNRRQTNGFRANTTDGKRYP